MSHYFLLREGWRAQIADIFTKGYGRAIAERLLPSFMNMQHKVGTRHPTTLDLLQQRTDKVDTIDFMWHGSGSAPA
eukprot:4674018-Amphidinium_carterae.1